MDRPVCQKKLLARVAGFASVLALMVIGLGAFTRLSDAGLGCPDWPGCYGHLVVSHSLWTKGWIEMVHRYAVGLLSLSIIIIVALTLLCRPLRMRGNLLLVMSLVVLLCYQILLGRWTVTLKLMPVIVTQHLLGGFLIFTTLWLTYLHNRPAEHELQSVRERSRISVFIYFMALSGMVLLLLQILLGAWTSTNYAALVCPDFPFCHANYNGKFDLHGALRLSFSGINYEGGVLPIYLRETIQMMHRMGALVVSCWLLLFSAVAFLQLPAFSRCLRTLYCLLALLIIQICLGIVNAIYKLPLATAVAHTMIAAILLATLVTFIYRLDHDNGMTMDSEQ